MEILVEVIIGLQIILLGYQIYLGVKSIRSKSSDTTSEYMGKQTGILAIIMFFTVIVVVITELF